MRFLDFGSFSLLESINDRYLFKAVFIVGGPGSGKSYYTNRMFADLFKVNSDLAFEKMLKVRGLPQTVDPASSDYEVQMGVRDRAKQITDKRFGMAIDGMLPLVIDGTGRRYEKIRLQRAALQGLGYDTYMVFVNTSLKTALDRNRSRDRRLRDDMVKDMWKAVQDNLHKFAALFDQEHFFVVESGDQETKVRRTILESPLDNRIGKRALYLLKSKGGKYLSDLHGK